VKETWKPYSVPLYRQKKKIVIISQIVTSFEIMIKRNRESV